MNINSFGFLVIEYGFDGDKVVVRGRCTEGRLSKGGVFTYAYPVIAKTEGRSISLKKGKIRNVDLEIQEVRMYGKKVDFIDSGLTGELVLKGEGREFVEVGGALSSGGLMEDSKTEWM